MMGSTVSSSREVSASVGLMGDSSSDGSAMVKSDRVAMLIDGDCVMGVMEDAGIVSVSGAATDSSGGDWGI